MVNRGAGFKKLMEEISKCELICSNCHRLRTFKGDVAQLGERLNGIQEVVGSIPIVSTRKGGERCQEG